MTLPQSESEIPAPKKKEKRKSTHIYSLRACVIHNIRRQTCVDADIPVAVASELNLGISLTKPSVPQRCIEAEIPVAIVSAGLTSVIQEFLRLHDKTGTHIYKVSGA